MAYLPLLTFRELFNRNSLALKPGLEISGLCKKILKNKEGIRDESQIGLLNIVVFHAILKISKLLAGYVITILHMRKYLKICLRMWSEVNIILE